MTSLNPHTDGIYVFLRSGDEDVHRERSQLQQVLQHSAKQQQGWDSLKRDLAQKPKVIIDSDSKSFFFPPHSLLVSGF
jgi:hypothetical protein